MFVFATAYSLFTSLAGASWFEETYSIELSRTAIAMIIIASIAVFVMFARLNVGSRYWSTLSVFGGATYAFYLLHQNVGYLALSALLPHVPAFGAILAVASSLFIFSILFHVTVERWLNASIRQRLFAALVGQKPAAQQ